MHDVSQDATKVARVKSRGNMFLVDLPTYAAVCDLGDADAAAVYLILAAGTGADNRTSTWSREAVNKRTGLNWRKADACIAKLEQAGFVRWLSGKGTRKPRIDLPMLETRPRLQKHVAELADRIMHGEQPSTAKGKGAATIGKDQGWHPQDEDGTWDFVPVRPMVKAYLPNALVGDETGKATGESTIVDRIRLSRDPMAFRLLVDLYALQDLAEHGGVNRASLYRKFERETIKATGQFQIWRFHSKSSTAPWNQGLDHHFRDPTETEMAQGWEASNKGAGFFSAAGILEDSGALEWVYYLAEDGQSDSTRVYPVAVERHGKVCWCELETIVGSYATRAACVLSDNHAGTWEGAMPREFLLPAERIAREAVLVGVPRLRCRAKTTNAARWRKELVEDATGVIQMFRGIIAERAPAMLVEADHRLADFNDTSTETSRLVQRDINDTSSPGKNDGSALRAAVGGDWVF